jgi:hypothetical protein
VRRTTERSTVEVGPRVGDVGGEFVTEAPVSVAVVSSRVEAELIVGLLRSHGLRAAVVTDDAGGQEPQWQLNGVHVLVPVSDEQSARELLATVDDPAGPLGGG